MEIVTHRNCRTCKEYKNLNDFNKGNSAYGKKSECRICQNIRSREYKSRPSSKEKRLNWGRQKYKNMTVEERTEYYEKSKERVSRWIKNNPDRVLASRKARENRRRLRISSVGPIEFSSVIALQSYNVSAYGKGDNPFTCEYCFKKISEYHLEHIHPICKGGTNSLSNLAITCPECNLSKGSKLLEFWDKEIANRIRERKL